jgi:hypothetical protein
MACALVLLCSMGQVDNTHSTTVRTVYAGVFPTRHTDTLLAFADVLRYPRTLRSERTGGVPTDGNRRESMAGALDGIRVIDFGQWLAGPPDRSTPG